MGLFDRNSPKPKSAAEPDSYEHVEMPAYPDDVDQLGLQLYPANYFDYAELLPDEYVAQEDIPGIATTIIVDRPDSVMVLIDDQQRQWNEHRKSVIAKLKEKLKTAKPYDVSFIDLGQAEDDDDSVIALIDHQDITAATHALVLEDLYPQLMGAKGALVGVPLRHLILVKKLQDTPDPAIVAAFQALVRHLAEENDGYLSDAAYLYRHGKYTFAPLT
jgi:hypothetical protein